MIYEYNGNIEIRGKIAMTNDKPYLVLTAADKAILESYAAMVPNLGEYLGDGYEIILHSLENLHHSVIENVNGHYSGRANGAPITDLALSMLSKIEHDKSHANICYMNRSKSGVPLRSSTIPIFGEHKRIIGLLCINFYTDIPFSSVLKKFSFDSPTIQSISPEIRENFAENTDELIETALAEIKNTIMNDLSISSQNKNKEIVLELYHRGILTSKILSLKLPLFLVSPKIRYTCISAI